MRTFNQKLYQPSMTPEPMSIEQTIAAFQRIYKGFPDYSWNIHELIAKRDKVIAWAVFTGTHEGELFRFRDIRTVVFRLS